MPQISPTVVPRHKDAPRDARSANIMACEALGRFMESMLGPRGRDSVILEPDGQMTVTNDGATTLSLMRVQHPAAQLMVQLSCAMDESAGDGTTSVVVLCAAMLGVAKELITRRGLHVHQACLRPYADPAQLMQACLIVAR
jgi:chaperonin GroEL (HSP60 family)